MEPHEKLIVAGLGRCGSSLLMQMLDAGGFPVTGTFPDYENNAATEGFDMTIAPAGKATKILDPHRAKFSLSDPYRWIWLTRDTQQQAKSMIKLLEHQEVPIINDRRHVRAMQKSLEADSEKCRRLINSCGGSVLKLTFEMIIRFPEVTASQLYKFIGGGLDVEAMAKAVIPRNTDCYPTMLENNLIWNIKST